MTNRVTAISARRPICVAAMADAGGLGFLAAGYKTPQVLQRQIAEVRARADVFGVNVLVPDESAAEIPQATAGGGGHASEGRPSRIEQRLSA